MRVPNTAKKRFRIIDFGIYGVWNVGNDAASRYAINQFKTSDTELRFCLCAFMPASYLRAIGAKGNELYGTQEAYFVHECHDAV